MKGSEKQIKWAEEIKECVVDTLQEMHDWYVNHEEFDPNNEKHVCCAEKFLHNIKAIETEEYAGDIIEMFCRVLEKKNESGIRRWKCFLSCLAVTGNAHKKRYAEEVKNA